MELVFSLVGGAFGHRRTAAGSSTTTTTTSTRTADDDNATTVTVMSSDGDGDALTGDANGGGGVGTTEATTAGATALELEMAMGKKTDEKNKNNNAASSSTSTSTSTERLWSNLNVTNQGNFRHEPGSLPGAIALVAEPRSVPGCSRFPPCARTAAVPSTVVTGCWGYMVAARITSPRGESHHHVRARFGRRQHHIHGGKNPRSTWHEIRLGCLVFIHHALPSLTCRERARSSTRREESY